MVRKNYVEIDVGIQLVGIMASPRRAVLDTGDEPSIVPNDRLPAGWSAHEPRAPRSTHVCDASGQHLKARRNFKQAVLSEDQRMVQDFTVVKALSVSLILGMDFRGSHGHTIYAQMTPER